MQTPSTPSSTIFKSRFGFFKGSPISLQSLPDMFRLLFQFAIAHYRTFIDSFDPVRSLSSHSHLRHQITPENFQQQNFHSNFQRRQKSLAPSTSTKTFNLHFAIPFFIVLYAAVQVFLGLDFFSKLISTISSGSNGAAFGRLIVDFSSTDFVPHQIFPQQMWAQSDLVLGFSTVNMLLIYFNLMRRPMLPFRFHMFKHYYPKIRKADKQQNESFKLSLGQHQHHPVLIGADHILTRKESYRILKLRQTVKHTVKVVFAVWFIGVEIYFNFQLLFSTNMASIGLLGGLFWIVVAPAFVIYGIFTNMLMIVFLILSLKYLHIKQESLLEQMRRLTASFSFPIDQVLADNSSSFRKAVLWRKYYFLNGRLIFLCEEIQGNGRFWGRYLTSIYMLYISFITYSIYALFIVQTGLFEKSFFVLMIGNSTAYLYLVIWQCSKVVRLNGALERENMHCLQYFKMANFSVESLLKAGNISQNQLATFYGIRFINNYLIDANTLHLTFYYITSFFMLNFKNMV